MRKIIGLAGAAALVATGVLSVGAASASKPGTFEGDYVEGGHKVTLCHRTGSVTNPFVVITTDIAAVNGAKKNDHAHHEAVHPGGFADVIPPIPGVDSGDGVGEGKNWTDNWDPGASKEVIAEACGGGGEPDTQYPS